MSGPVFRDYNWRDLLSRIDADLDKPAVAYQFGNGRKFIDSGANGGVYSASSTPPAAASGSAVVDIAIVDIAVVDHP